MQVGVLVIRSKLESLFETFVVNVRSHRHFCPKSSTLVCVSRSREVGRLSRIPWVMRQIGYETPRRAEITDRLRKSTKRWGVVRSGPSDVIVIDASNVESSCPALRRIPTTRVSARLSFGGGFRRLTLRRVAHLIIIVGVSAGIDRFRRGRAAAIPLSSPLARRANGPFRGRRGRKIATCLRRGRRCGPYLRRRARNRARQSFAASAHA